MSILWLLTPLLASLLQAGAEAPINGEIFNSTEKAQMAKAADIEQRIKVYEAASKRIQQSLETAVSKDDFQSVPDNLKLWTALLSKSLEDIEANLKTKKKSKALKNYEIQLRKSIGNTGNYKIRAPVEQQDIFDSSLAQAETIRKRFVEIFFRH
jgi:hypothetical protein